MNEEPVLTEADRIQEELVAYLDNELDDEASERVVERLKSDPAYQQQLKDLQAAWDLLDELPQTAVADSFTQTTIKMVALSAESETLSAEKRLAQRRYWGAAAMAVAAGIALLAGYLAISYRLDEPNRRLVHDLPVIENVDLYRVADNVEFLRSLEEAQLFDEEQADVP